MLWCNKGAGLALVARNDFGGRCGPRPQAPLCPDLRRARPGETFHIDLTAIFPRIGDTQFSLVLPGVLVGPARSDSEAGLRVLENAQSVEGNWTDF